MDEIVLYAYEFIRMEYLTKFLKWTREKAENPEHAFFINCAGEALIGKNGIDCQPFINATGCGEISGASFRTMASDYGMFKQSNNY